MSNKGYYGLNGPNQEALRIAACVKAEQRAMEEAREYDEQRELERERRQDERLEKIFKGFSSFGQNSEPINPFGHISIVNADSVIQNAATITNITLTEEQFKQLLDAVSSK